MFHASTQTFSISNEVRFYSLTCNRWVDQQALYKFSPAHNSPVGKRFESTVIQKDKQTMVLVGGYNGAVVLGDVVAYRLPKTVANVNEKDNSLLAGQHCSSYDSQGKEFSAVKALLKEQRLS